MLSSSLKFILVQNFAPPCLKLWVSEFLLGIYEILHSSVSAPNAKIVPLRDVHRLLMLSAGTIIFSDSRAFLSGTSFNL
jgi:hypothetical protein